MSSHPLKRNKIPLFWKFTGAIVFIVTIFGIINLYLMDFAVYDLFQKELLRHGRTTAKTIASQSIDPIAYNDLAQLNKIVSEQKQIDENVAYIFILDINKKVLAHTFESNIPENLLQLNSIGKDEKFSSIKIEYPSITNSIIRDISVRILEGNLGTVRMGIYEENYFKSIKKTQRIFLAMVVIFLIVGIIGAFIFSYIITTPIKAVSEVSKHIELGNVNIFNAVNQLENSEIVKWKNLLNVNDEIDILIKSFVEMINRLEATYRELQKTQKSLIQSEKMASLGTLSAGIAHEINNPIAGMQNCIRRLKENPRNIKQNIEYLSLMGEAVNKMESVVGGLLNYSRKQELVFVKTNIVEIIENVLVLSAYNFEKNRISIRKLYNHKPRFAKVSPNHVEQLLLNIIINAIEAICEKKLDQPEYKGEVVFNISESKNSIKIEVSDNGIGIPNDKIKEIFNPFFTHKKIRQGTGLGLAVGYSIIEQHGGTIRVMSNPISGLTFVIKLYKSKNTNDT